MNSSVGYLVKKGITSIWLNKFMSMASIAILTACLIILGGAGLLTVNLKDIFKDLESQNEIYVFMQDDLTEEQIKGTGDALAAIEHVTDVLFVSSDEGLDIMRDYLGAEDAYLLDGLKGDNPLPPAFHVTLDNLENIDSVHAAITKLSYIDTISAPTQLADTLTGIKRTAIILGSIIIGILFIASIVVINNTIKLTVFARRKEINIMKYVGATNSFIRLPFIVEGITLGLCSAVIAFFIILFVYQSLAGMLNSTTIAWLSAAQGQVISFSSLWMWILGGFALSGILIGSYGSSAAIRRHLQV